MEVIVAFFLAMISVILIRRFAPAWGLVDMPNERSLHDDIVPRGAGIGFFLSAVVTNIFFHTEYVMEHAGIFLAVSVVVVAGLLDDLHDIGVKLKFMLLTLAALIVCFQGICINDVGDFFGIHITFGWAAIPFTVFAIVGYTNALNLIDGLDGLAASISIVILSGFLYIGLIHQDEFLLMLSSSFIAVLLAFLIFNWRPASIFMGDSGSLLLGFVIAILSIHSLAYLPPMHVLFMIAIPVLDTLVVIVRRIRNNQPIFQADQCHIHHIMIRFFRENTSKTVIFLTILQAIYTFTSLHLNSDIDSGILLILFILNAFLIYLGLNGIIVKQDKRC